MKQAVIAFCMLVMGLGVFAQPQQGQGMPSAEERAKRQTERLKTELSLNADQEKKVYDLYLASGKKMEEMRKNAQGDREAMRAKMDESRKEQDVKLKTILTEAQYTKYQELQKKWEAERQQHRGQGGPGGQRPQN